MDFTEAALLQLKAKEASEAFVQAVKEKKTEIQDELNNIVITFRNVMEASRQTIYALSLGGYLYLKSSGSTLSVTEERITTAVENMTIAQLKRISEEEELESPVDVVLMCIEENLEDVCVSIKDVPTVVKNRPDIEDAVSKPIPMAPPALDAAAQRYKILKQRLAEVNKAVRKTNKRCAEAIAAAEPAIMAFMNERDVKVQSVMFAEVVPESMPVPERPLELPPIPQLLPTHVQEDHRHPESTPSVPSLPMACKAQGVEAQQVRFRIKQPKPRGRIPRLRQFTDSIESPLTKLIRSKRNTDLKRWASKDGKTEILGVLLEQHKLLYEATKTMSEPKLTMSRSKRRRE